MIYLVVGENSYQAQSIIRKLVGGDTANIRYLDAENADVSMLSDAFFGVTLFSDNQPIVLRDFSQQKVLWEQLAAWVDRLASSEQTIVIAEAKPDKRLKAYKTIHAAAKKVYEVKLWTMNEAQVATSWLRRKDSRLSYDQASVLVERATRPEGRDMVIDQQQLAAVLEALALLDAITLESIDALMSAQPQANALRLMDMGLSGHLETMQRELKILELNEDPHRLLALLSSQWLQLVTAKATPSTDARHATELGVHPYALRKMGDTAKRYSWQWLRSRTELFARLEAGAKQGEIEPWTAVYRILYALADPKEQPA